MAGRECSVAFNQHSIRKMLGQRNRDMKPALGLFLLGAAPILLEPASVTAGPRLASLDRPGQVTPWGDRMNVERPFGPWSLRCDLSVSQNKRLCALEQTITTTGGGILWRLALTADDEQVLVFSAPADLDWSAGLSIDAGMFSGAIKGDQWSCRQVCIAIVRFDGLMQRMLLESRTIGMRYRTSKGRDINLEASMDGFESALEAAAHDPFGKRPARAGLKKVPVPTSRPAGEGSE